MRTSSCKAKGRRCAQETKELLLKHAPRLQDGDIVVTSSGETGPDLKLSPYAREFYPYAVECKNVEALNIWKAMEQAESHHQAALPTQWDTPLLFFRRNRSKLYVALEAEAFLRLVRRG
jgi:hypothetical protein